MTRLLTTRARPLELGAGGLSTIICDDSTSRARNVSALFVDRRGPYPDLVTDWWDEGRDARWYDGANPVVAHPPCQLWGPFAAGNFARWGGEHNRPGNDGGCFSSAVESVRRVGGVLEHPAFSRAWVAHNLPEPRATGWSWSGGNEYVCEVWQSAYGHRARKRTWLMYVGAPPKELNWERQPGTHQCGFQDQRGKARNKPTLPKRERIETPVQFAKELVGLAAASILLVTGCSLQTTTEGMAGALACGWEQRADVTTPADEACWEPVEPGVYVTPGWAGACDVTDNQLDSAGPGEHVRLWTRLSNRSDYDQISMKACEK